VDAYSRLLYGELKTEADLDVWWLDVLMVGIVPENPLPSVPCFIFSSCGLKISYLIRYAQSLNDELCGRLTKYASIRAHLIERGEMRLLRSGAEDIVSRVVYSLDAHLLYQ